VKTEALALLVEARPLVLTNLGNMALGLVDVAVVGRLGEREIAAAGLGNTIFFNVAFFGAGVLYALDPLIAQAIGAKERPNGARTLISGVALALLLSVPIALLIALLAVVIPPLSVDETTVGPTRDFVWARISSLVPFLLTLAARGYLQSHGRARSLMAGVVVANVVNLPAAILLVHGVPSLGIPGLGVIGAGLASGVASVAQLVVTAYPLRAMLAEDLGRAATLADADLARMAKVFRLGAPLGIQIALEAGSFWIVTLLIGTFGNTMLAAHHIALTAVSTTFQVALGIGGATSVRVGRAVGDGEGTERARTSARRAGLLGIAFGAGSMALGAVVFALMPGVLARGMTSELPVVAAAIPFFLVAACFQLSDGTQTVAQGALRGAGDTTWPLILNFGGHYLIGLPVGWTLAHTFGLGPVGLWWGLSAGLTAVAVLLLLRFERLTRRPIVRA
jgi:MATE family multidrug resistance protein